MVEFAKLHFLLSSCNIELYLLLDTCTVAIFIAVVKVVEMHWQRGYFTKFFNQIIYQTMKPEAKKTPPHKITPTASNPIAKNRGTIR